MIKKDENKNQSPFVMGKCRWGAKGKESINMEYINIRLIQIIFNGF